MNIFGRIRERIGAVIGAVIGSILACLCGLLFTFYLAPQQKSEANRIEKMPIMDATGVNNAPSGEDVLFTGRLADNPLVVEGDEFVAYQLDEWDVTVPEYDPDEPNQEPDGDWTTIETVFPDLVINVNGGLVRTLQANSLSLSGPVRETLVYGDGYEEASYDGELLPEGSMRYRGFYNGDLVTILGKKATSGDVIPDEFYAGDRVSFVEFKHDEAAAMLYVGIAMLACSPVILIGGSLTAIFGRRQNR